MRRTCSISNYFLVLLSLSVLGIAPSVTLAVQVGEPAPAFTLNDQQGKVHSLGEYRGQWVVVYFYPKDGTPGCTKEACRFRDNIAQLRALKAQILGISVDDAISHANFAQKYNLPFPLLADLGGNTAKAYDAYRSLGPFSMARRNTFIIDPEGRVAKIYREVDPNTHSTQIISDLKDLQRQ